MSPGSLSLCMELQLLSIPIIPAAAGPVCIALSELPSQLNAPSSCLLDTPARLTLTSNPHSARVQGSFARLRDVPSCSHPPLLTLSSTYSLERSAPTAREHPAPTSLPITCRPTTSTSSGTRACPRPRTATTSRPQRAWTLRASWRTCRCVCAPKCACVCA